MGSRAISLRAIPPLYFGLGDAATVEAVRVFWPSGKEQSLPGPIETNRLLEIREP